MRTTRPMGHILFGAPSIAGFPLLDPLARALMSRGYRGDYMPWQERRLRYVHDNIDRYLAMGPLG